MGFFTCYPCGGGRSGSSRALDSIDGVGSVIIYRIPDKCPHTVCDYISACPGPWGPSQHGQDECGQGTHTCSQFCLSSGWTARGLSCGAPDPVGSAGASGPKPVLPTGHEGPSVGDPENSLEAGGTESPLI